MTDTLAISYSHEEQEISDISTISMLLANSNSPSSAFMRFAEFLETRGYSLLLLSSCNTDQQTAPVNHYTNISTSLEAMCAQADTGLGCPIVQKAMQIRIPFEALGTDYSSCKDFSCQRYLSELTRLGHQEIAVIPIRTDKVMYIAVIGLNERLFKNGNKNHLMTVYGQFASALFVRFPELGQTGIVKSAVSSEGFSVKNFSEKEREVIFWRASGKSNMEIAKIFKLSESTVQHFMTAACLKLGAKSEPHAVSKAVKLGLFDFPDVN